MYHAAKWWPPYILYSMYGVKRYSQLVVSLMNQRQIWYWYGVGIIFKICDKCMYILTLSLVIRETHIQEKSQHYKVKWLTEILLIKCIIWKTIVLEIFWLWTNVFYLAIHLDTSMILQHLPCRPFRSAKAVTLNPNDGMNCAATLRLCL